MSNKRLRLILMCLLGAGTLLFVFIAVDGLSMLGDKSQKMTSLKLQSDVLNYKLSSLAQAKKQVQQYSYIESVAQEVIPNDKDQAQALLEISQLADQSGIAIQSVSFPTSTLGTANAAGASTSSLISQATPVSGIKGLYSVQLVITPETGPQVPADQQVTYTKTLDFLTNRIEHNQRTAQITQINILQQPVTGSSQTAITFSLTINIFIRP